MLYVVLKDGTTEELPDATQTIALDAALDCLNEKGKLIKNYERHAVLAFGHDEALKRFGELVRDEQPH